MTRFAEHVNATRDNHVHIMCAIASSGMMDTNPVHSGWVIYEVVAGVKELPCMECRKNVIAIRIEFLNGLVRKYLDKESSAHNQVTRDEGKSSYLTD